MKIKLFIILLFCFALIALAQENNNSGGYAILSSNLGSSGSSHIIKTSKGNYAISQSVGQASVIGTYSNNGYCLRQGYQQPSNKVQIVKQATPNNLNAIVYPNPFAQTVLVSFKNEILNEILVSVFDITGKAIYSKKFNPEQHIELYLDNLSTGSYLLKVSTSSKVLNTKLIKI